MEEDSEEEGDEEEDAEDEEWEEEEWQIKSCISHIFFKITFSMCYFGY